jgi:hypothetical protein
VHWWITYWTKVSTRAYKCKILFNDFHYLTSYSLRILTKEKGEDVFKIGRSTGRLFKEKGVSLYKDKEISTTHARIEIRNGQAFFVDNKSTNGSQLNGYVYALFGSHIHYCLRKCCVLINISLL